MSLRLSFLKMLMFAGDLEFHSIFELADLSLIPNSLRCPAQTFIFSSFIFSNAFIFLKVRIEFVFQVP